MTRHIRIALAAWLLAISTTVTAAQNSLELELDLGTSAVTGAAFEDLAIGFTVAGGAFYRINDFLFLGGHVGWVRWSPLRSAFLDAIAGAVSAVDADGSVWSLELVPTVRVTTNFVGNGLDLFATAGAGLYILRNDVTVEAVIVDPLGELRIVNRDLGTGTDAHFGYSLGGGFAVGKGQPVRVRFYPLWNYVFRDESPDQYITVNLGIIWVLRWNNRQREEGAWRGTR